MSLFQNPAQNNNNNANQPSGNASNPAEAPASGTSNVFGSGITFGASTAAPLSFGRTMGTQPFSGASAGTSTATPSPGGASNTPSTPTPNAFGGFTTNATTPGTSLFGSSATSNQTPGSNFFSGAKEAPSERSTGTTGGMFGSSNATGTPAPGGSVFGNLGNTGPATSTPAAASIFGNLGSAGSTTGSNAPAASGGGLFGNVGASTTPSTGTTLFGNANKPAGNTAPAGGNLFGTSTAVPGTSTPGAATLSAPAGGSPFGAAKPPEQGASSASQPAPPNFFAQPSTTGTSATAPATAPAGGLFGSVPKPGEAAASSVPAAPAAGGSASFSGGLFGNKPSTPSAPSGSTPAAASTPLFSFGTPSTTSKDASKDTLTASTSGTTGTSSFNFFAKKPDEQKDATAASTSTSTFIFGSSTKDKGKEKDTGTAPPEKKDGISTLFGTPASIATKEGDKSKDATNAVAPSAFGISPSASAPSIAVPPPSVLRGKTLEEIVNKWSTELETQVREFDKLASEVAVWDRTLIENGNNLAALYAHVLAAEQEQNDIDQSLDHIEQQQKELTATLEAYEKSTEEILGGQGGNLRALDTGPADTERDKNYTLATELHGHLDDLSGSLTQMIDTVNALALSSEKSEQDHGEDAMTQIAQILNGHLESLLWIDGAVQEVDSKIKDVEKHVRMAGEASLGGGFKGKSFGLGASR